ncbi:MAG: hypothetical protein QOI58_1708 [Thermoanaerobaculia bacterium]|jgi:hypothetical protein|nr:hypothetical protein [Thermoanaerobaculia bacterium]
MNWTTLDYSRGQVDAAGRLLASGLGTPEEIDIAFEVLNNWRAVHSFPLNTIQMGLRTRARRIYEHALVAQRLKRVPSIVLKLRRFSSMNLSRMQDIGGCRAILESVNQVRKVRAAYARSEQQHQFVSEKDYISSPKASGYRGIHLVYRYHSDRNPDYNGRSIEIQLRTRLQHAWATAVETVGTFLQQSLKSSEGSEKWLRFFALTGSAFALAERTQAVPETPQSPQELTDFVRTLEAELDVRKTLGAYGEALKIAEDTQMAKAYYFLLSLTPSQEALSVFGYQKEQLDRATDHYLQIEKALPPGGQAVLVAVESLSALKKSYPNYFLDTQVFTTALGRVIDR